MIKKRISILAVLVLLAINSKSQEKHISGFIDKDIIFSSDTSYFVDFHTRVSSNATLTILPNTKLFFASGASIIIDGGLQILGKQEQVVSITSLDKDFQGIGFVISGHNDRLINIKYCHFEELLMPLSFKDDWYRKQVRIEHSVFRHIQSGKEAIYIGFLSQLYTDFTASLTFSNNNFIENNATIYIASTNDDALQINFNNNLIQSNCILDKEMANPLNAALTCFYNQIDNANNMLLFDNSISNNSILSGINKENKIEINFGIHGSGESFHLNNNFLGNTKRANKTLIHFLQNNKLPLVLLTNLQKQPSSKVHAHIWKVEIKSEMGWKEFFISDSLPITKDIHLRVYYNRAVDFLDLKQIEFVHYDTEKDTLSSIFFAIENLSIQKNILEFKLQNIAKVHAMDNGAFILPFAKDNEGFISPNYSLGNYNKVILFKEGVIKEYLQSKEELVLVERIPSIDNEITTTKNTLSIGTSFGGSLFSGDVNSTIKSAPYFGLFMSYTLSPEILLKVELATTTLSSITQDDLSKNFNISTDVTMLNLTLSYQLNRLTFVKIKPHFFIGASVFHFQPKGVYKGYYHDLKPLKTEGQEEEYTLNQFAIPIGFGFKRVISKNFSLVLDFTLHKVFTDYLDDVSGVYADYENILSEQGEIAAHFSDPSRTNMAYDYQKNGDRGNTYNKDNFYSILLSISKTIR
jgi:hypothetical protein